MARHLSYYTGQSEDLILGKLGKLVFELEDFEKGDRRWWMRRGGCIFEKYISQKEFGAYCTRPEITEYLCDRTINKLILDKVNAERWQFGSIVPSNITRSIRSHDRVLTYLTQASRNPWNTHKTYLMTFSNSVKVLPLNVL